MKRTLLGGVTLAVPSLIIAVCIVMLTPARSKNAKPAGAEIRVDNFSFGPGTLTVPVNSTVNWTNKDDVPHVIASTDGLFKSKALDTDDVYSYTFTKPGTYAYYCSVHPKMVGTIIVR
jgi:plastocyanin